MSKIKTPSLKYQVQENLKSKLQIGVKRHSMPNHGKGIGMGIHSWNTYHSYVKWCINFTGWVKTQHSEVKTLIDCQPYVADYVKHLQSDGKSAWTQHLALSALKKLYDYDFKEITLPKRERKNITRSRGQSTMDRSFSESRNAELVEFCRSTGLRRAELSALRGSDLEFTTDGATGSDMVLHVTRGTKGGRSRRVPVVGNEGLVAQLCSNAGDGLVFPDLPQKADIHRYRGDYAKRVYDWTARNIDNVPHNERYYCRGDRKGQVYDKRAMRIASEALGHHRLEVIAKHYLYESDNS